MFYYCSILNIAFFDATQRLLCYCSVEKGSSYIGISRPHTDLNSFFIAETWRHEAIWQEETTTYQRQETNGSENWKKSIEKYFK